MTEALEAAQQLRLDSLRVQADCPGRSQVQADSSRSSEAAAAQAEEAAAAATGQPPDEHDTGSMPIGQPEALQDAAEAERRQQGLNGSTGTSSWRSNGVSSGDSRVSSSSEEENAFGGRTMHRMQLQRGLRSWPVHPAAAGDGACCIASHEQRWHM